MTKEIAQEILKIVGYAGYDITDIYETSFRAIRKNEWVLSELNVECLIDVNRILYVDTDDRRIFIRVCVHILKRYK